MADDKTVSLRVDGSQGENALQGIERAAEGAAEAMGQLGAEVERTETQTKRLAGTSRDYNSAARSVGDSIQSIAKFEAAYRASLVDTGNSAQVRAQILESAFNRTIGGAINEARAVAMLAGTHKDAASGIRFIIDNLDRFSAATQAAAQADNVAAAAAASNAAIRVNVAQKAAEAARVAALPVDRGYLDGMAPLSNKSAGESAGVFAAAFREQAQAAAMAQAAEQKMISTRLENERVSRQWEAMLEAEAVASRNAAVATEKQEQQLRTLLGIYAPAAARSKTLAEHQQQLNGLFSAGKMTAQEHAAVLRNLQTQQALNSAEMVRMASGAKLNGYALTGLSYQVNDVITQYASGTPVQQIFAQQAGQFVQIFQQAGIGLTRFAGPLAALAVPLSVGGALIWEMGKKSREAAAAIETFAEVEKKLQGVLERTNELTKTSIELARLKAQAAKEGANASLREQEVAANAAFVAQGQKVWERRKKIDDNGGRDSDPTGTRQMEEEFERLHGILLKIDQAKRDITTQAPMRLADSVLTSAQPKAELEAKRADIEAGIVDARGRGDEAALMRLTEAYGAVNRAIATYVTDGQRAAMMAEAQAKASGMTATEGQKYLTVRMAEINAMGKAIELGELEQQQKAAQVEAATTAAKAYRDMAKAMTMGEIETTAKIAVSGLDAERQALAQRRALGEIGAADELTLALDIEERKRQIAEQAAQAKLALLRRTAGTERTEIDAAERTITELKAQHETERKRQADEAMAARIAQAKQLAQIEAEAVASSAGRKVDSKAEDVAMGKVTGDISGPQAVADAERALAAERLQIELGLLNEKLALASQEPAERARILNDIRAAEEKHAIDLKRIDRQATQDRLSEIKEWTDPFKSAVNSTTTGFIQGTLTKRRAAAQAAQSIAASYLSKFATIATDAFNKHVLMAAWDRTFGAQEVATKTAVEAKKAMTVTTGQAAQTTATRVGSTQRAIAGSTEDAGFFARVGRQIAEWFGMESAKTGATITGEGVRTGVTATGAAAREGVDMAQTTSSVGQSAARGAAGTYADVSEHIPFGWVIAPAMAAAAFVAIKAFSSRGGEAEVSQDGALYTLHEKETVLPAAFAVPLRSALYSGALSGKAATPEHVQSAMSALMSAGPSQDRTSAAIAATGLGIPSAGRFALPDWLGKGPNFQAGNTTTNTTNRTEKRVHVSNTFNISALDGASVKRVLMDNKGAVSEAMLKALANSDPNAMAFKSKK